MVGERDKFPKANLLLDCVLGAEIDIITIDEGEETFESMARAMERSKAHIERLSENEDDCYIIPPGGATDIGTLGFINAYLELKEDEQREGISFDEIFHATGTGGTLAGLVAANSYIEDDIRINGINIIHEGETYISLVEDLSNKSLDVLAIKEKVSMDKVNIDPNFVGEGYEIPTASGNRAIRMFAKEEGIFLDPVYTGKAAGAMIDYIENGKIEQGSNILFWHTGGTNALFADEKILGDLID